MMTKIAAYKKRLTTNLPGTKAVSVADIYRACGSQPAVLR
jgi:hypothetical protein